jgi:hypothetical protein
MLGGWARARSVNIRFGLSSPLAFCKQFLFRVAGLFHGAANSGLARFQHLIDTRLTSQRSRNVLTHRGAERLKFRDTHKLNSGVWDRLNARIGRVGALQRPERSSSEGGLLVFRVFVGRLSCPGRNSTVPGELACAGGS